MHLTMVKKRLANGELCEKCAQTEEMLRRRGVWDRIDEVVWAIEGEPDSPGYRLGARHGVSVAPFFVVREDDGREIVVTSGLRLIRDFLPDAAEATAPGRGRNEVPSEDALDVEALRQRFEGAEPEALLRFAAERFGERCKLGFSGAEEVVLIDMASRLGLPLRAFVLDTGRLHDETHAFLDEVRRRYGIEIEVYLPDAAALDALVRSRGMNGFYRDGHRECCAVRKVAPLARALAGCDAWITGRRRDQSPATRANLPVAARERHPAAADATLLTLSPLAAWSRERVFDYARRHDVPLNTLHERGYASIGCAPCTRPVVPGEPVRSGRWWWEAEGERESGLHVAGDGI